MDRHHIRSLDELRLSLPGSVVTVGVFDGLHLGHQTILDRVLASARRRELPSVCVTFSVHPKAVLLGEAPRQILSVEHRLERIEEAGLEHAVVIEFSPEFAAVEAETFVEDLLVRRLGVRELVIGHDTAVGRHRRGDARFLAEAGLRYGFKVVSIGEVHVDGLLVSSTTVRRAIAAGELVTARRLLGRPASLRGTIVHGDGRGATIGFPTANLEVVSEAFPPLGVYAVTLRCEQGDLPGVMNYGLRPTFAQDETHAVFEIHVLDRRDLDLYGQRVEVFLHRFLRREERFASSQALVAQIDKDCESAREALRGVSVAEG
ncbi:MAG: riboflavin biosynthesis protein RibF [Planctomycetes bacterium]|nr:riboflavin biosynthesis protein RibF [Planctomycetota bacterium]